MCNAWKDNWLIITIPGIWKHSDILFEENLKLWLFPIWNTYLQQTKTHLKCLPTCSRSSHIFLLDFSLTNYYNIIVIHLHLTVLPLFRSITHTSMQICFTRFNMIVQVISEFTHHLTHIIELMSKYMALIESYPL